MSQRHRRLLFAASPRLVLAGALCLWLAASAAAHDPPPPPHGPVLFTDAEGHNHLFAHGLSNGDGTTTHDHDSFSAWHDRVYDDTNPFGHGFIREDVAQPRYSFTAPGGAGNTGTAIPAAGQTILNNAFDLWETRAHAVGPALPGRRTGIDFDNNNTTFEFRSIMIDNLRECRAAGGEWAYNASALLADSNFDSTGDGIGDCPVALGAAYTALPAGRYLLFDDDLPWEYIALSNTTTSPAAGNRDFATIALHEAGHVVGLLHTPGDPANHIMRESIVTQATGAFLRTIEDDSAFGAAELYTVTRGIRTDTPQIPTGRYIKLGDVDPTYVTQFGTFVLKQTTHKNFTTLATSASGADIIETFESDLEGMAETPFGTFPVSLHGPVSVQLFGYNGQTTGSYLTEMLSMNMEGDVVVPGFGTFHVVVRENPNPAFRSMGEIEIMEVSDGIGHFAIDSFFDVFTELSIAGTPFSPDINGPAHVDLVPEPASVVLLGVGLACLLALRFKRRRGLNA